MKSFLHRLLFYINHTMGFSLPVFKIVKQRKGECTFYLNNSCKILAEAYTEGKGRLCEFSAEVFPFH